MALLGLLSPIVCCNALSFVLMKTLNSFSSPSVVGIVGLPESRRDLKMFAYSPILGLVWPSALAQKARFYIVYSCPGSMTVSSGSDLAKFMAFNICWASPSKNFPHPPTKMVSPVAMNRLTFLII